MKRIVKLEEGDVVPDKAVLIRVETEKRVDRVEVYPSWLPFTLDRTTYFKAVTVFYYEVEVE